LLRGGVVGGLVAGWHAAVDRAPAASEGVGAGAEVGAVVGGAPHPGLAGGAVGVVDGWPQPPVHSVGADLGGEPGPLVAASPQVPAVAVADVREAPVSVRCDDLYRLVSALVAA